MKGEHTMLEQKERYIVTLADGKQINAKCSTFAECIAAFGEENIVAIEKLDYEEE
ncbi:MAG: hypothetical protein IJ907_08850 [Prevotella sp.]|nr:hypothetical protein [Prevotella sp.]